MDEVPRQEPPPPPPPAAPPAYYWSQAPPPGRRPGRNAIVIGAIVAAAVIVVGAVGAYALVGDRVASDRIASANSAIGKARSHHTDFEHSMSGVGQGFGSLSDTSITPAQFKTAADELTQKSQQQVAIVSDDHSKVDAAGKRLHDSQWLTLLSKGSVDRETARVQHAQTALDAAMTMTTDYVQDGQFLQAYGDSLVDLEDIATREQANNDAGAIAAVSKLKSDTDKALRLATAPGLPPEVHQFMVLFQTLATDFQDVLAAAQSGNSSAVAAAENKGNADLEALKAVDISRVGAEIASFYQPYETKFNQEMDQATG